jgi:hypothetical protein
MSGCSSWHIINHLASVQSLSVLPCQPWHSEDVNHSDSQILAEGHPSPTVTAPRPRCHPAVVSDKPSENQPFSEYPTIVVRASRRWLRQWRMSSPKRQSSPELRLSMKLPLISGYPHRSSWSTETSIFHYSGGKPRVQIRASHLYITFSIE